MGKKILEIAKYIGAIATIGAAALFFDNMKDSVNDTQHSLMDTLLMVDDKVNSVQDEFNEYKKTTNTHRVYKAEQTNKLINEIGILRRNQNAIINNSSEQNEILEEIKTQQLLNGTAHIEPISPIEPDKLVYLNK